MKDDVQNSEIGNRLPPRQVLRSILDEGEQKVPSTTANIMAAIQREQQTAQKVSTDNVSDAQNASSPVPLPQIHEIVTPRPKKSRRRLYNALALITVAAALIASFGLLSLLMPHGSMNAGTTTASSGSSVNTVPRYLPSAPATTSSWSSVIITYKMNSMTIIANYEPVTANSTKIASSYVDTIVDGVSHDGREVLYSIFDGSKTSYYIYPQSTANAIFTTNDDSRSAIWSTDDRTLFISTSTGVMSVNVQTHAAKLLFPALPSVTLLNYRDDGYLYFVKGDTGQAYATQGTFNRINITQGNSQQITSCIHGANFWLSPSGTTVYYHCLDQNADILYAMSSDGTNPHVFRTNAGNIIGYADDGSPLTLVKANGKYQVVQRNVTTEQDTVVIQDVAPKAILITADDVAVAPFGQTLVVKATYSNNGQTTHGQFWYSNVTTGNSQTFLLPQSASMSQVIGWDKLQVSGEISSPTP